MKYIKNKNYIQLVFILLLISLMSFGFLGDDKNSQKKNDKPVYKTNQLNNDEGGKKGDAYRLNINNINLPLNRKGIIAAVNIPDPNPIISGAGGKFGGHVFLFSSGFFLSGYANGQLWANAVASASLVEDYIQGTVKDGRNDSRAQIYVLKASDVPFGQSWQDWKDAVDLGADFYDGDGDGIYNPIDKNGNGEWDLDEDRPDLLGDETVWTVYHDGIAAPQRRWIVDPLGIEVRQTVFAFASSGAVGNLIFVRYRIKYVGLGNPGEPEKLDDVYLGIWADPDLGFASDDLVGVDVPRNAGYTYQKTPDAEYGNQPPCFMIDFFSGPLEFIPGETFIDNDGDSFYTEGIDTPIDTAYSIRGSILGIKTIPGAKNLPISSFVQYINGDPDLRDPSTKEEARNYILGKDRAGRSIDPCTFAYGTVVGGVDCNTVDPRFWYSGDPVANVGWIATQAVDARQMTNTGPFVLRKNEEKEVVVAYVVGQGSNPLQSISVARQIDDGAQVVFNNNFLAPSAPPAPKVITEANENFIDLIWETKEQFNYSSVTDAYDLKFGGYNVYAFKTFNSGETINNQENRKLIARYQVKNFIKSLYFEDPDNKGIFLLYEQAPSENQLDTNTFKQPNRFVKLRITKDPFTGGPLVKGKPYYFVVTGYGVNYKALLSRSGGNLGTIDDYYLSSLSFVQAAENPVSLNSFKTVIFGQDMYNPVYPDEIIADKLAGVSKGKVGYSIVDKSNLKNDEYQVTFFRDTSSITYKMFWKLTNLSRNEVLIDSGASYGFGINNFFSEKVTDGFILKVQEQVPKFGVPFYNPSNNVWYSNFNFESGTGVFYVGQDIEQGSIVPIVRPQRSNYISADKLGRVELRFGEYGKAYRYLNGYRGSNTSRKNSYIYAEALTPADTIGRGVIGNWNFTLDRPNGFIDVPFKAYLVNEDGTGQPQQLAVGIIEKSSRDGGNPDGAWDPGDSLSVSSELIVVFSSPYDANGNQIELTGGIFKDENNQDILPAVWSDLLRAFNPPPQIPANANVTAEQRKIFNSPWLSTLYVIGLQKKTASSFYSPGDVLTIPVTTYPYTSQDVYKFRTNNELLTIDQKRALFEKVNVFPNPLYGVNTAGGYYNKPPDEPFVTFSNLPDEEVSIKIYSLSGQLLRSLKKDANDLPFLTWDLKNESGLRVASGIYLAIVSAPTYGEKVLKFSIIMPQKQLPRF